MSEINIKFDWEKIGADLTDLARKIFSKRVEDLVGDEKAFLQANAQKLFRYHLALATHRLSQDEYDDLIDDLGAIALLEKYKQEGLTEIAIDQFANGAIDILIEAALAAIP